MNGSPSGALTGIYVAFLTIASGFTVGGLVLVVLVVRRVVGYHAIASIGVWSMGAVAVSVAAFALCRGLARWFGNELVPSAGRARNLLLFTAVVGVLVGLLASNFQVFSDSGVWTEGRVVSEHGEFWVYSAGEKLPATALDFEMESRIVQLVPLVVAVFLSGLFQAYLAIDQVVPGVVPRALFAPWRLVSRNRKPDVHEEHDAYSPCD